MLTSTAATTRIRALAAELGPSTGRIHRRPRQEVTRTLDGFRLGSLNPLSVPATVRVQRPGSVVADLEPDALAEGPPDRMHGGAIAWLFDNIMGMALQSLDLRCATGTLTLRFVAPTPLDAALRMTAEADEPQGRKVTVRAACTTTPEHRPSTARACSSCCVRASGCECAADSPTDSRQQVIRGPRFTGLDGAVADRHRRRSDAVDRSADRPGAGRVRL